MKLLALCPQQTMSMLISIGIVTVTTTLAFGQAPYSKSGRLVTVVPGIRDEASNVWVALAATITPTTEKWVIHEEGDPKYKNLKDRNLSQVPEDHIITIPANASNEQMKIALKSISKTRDVTVIVDMNLENRVTEAGWSPHTKWASSVSETLAESHAAQYSNAQNLFIGHSAGTEPMAMMPPKMLDLRKNHEGENRRLYDNVILLSGRRDPKSAEYPKWAVLAFADGDFYSNPGGSIGTGTILKTYGEADAIQMAKSGYQVVRVVNSGGSGWTDSMIRGAATVLMPISYEAKQRIDAHRRVTDFTTDIQSVYYEPTTAVAMALPKGPLMNGLLLAVKESASAAPNAQNAIEQLRVTQPTKGIGGISLNATAFVPFEPAEIESAGYSEERHVLFLRLKNGKKIQFPTMPPEVLVQTYKTVYVDGLRPELSISRGRATAPDGTEVSNVQEAGKASVYYFGNSKDSMLGLAMFNADHMLGELAFSNSSDVQNVARHVPGFHSLLELFPEKYAKHPGQGEYYGSDGRVFLTPRTVVMKEALKEGDLEFDEFGVSIHFGQPGPVESVYGAFFEAHFDDILKSESGRAFAELIPFARASAIFRWMRDNSIQFLPGKLNGVEVSQVFTPTAIDWRPRTELADIEVRLPTVFFGLNGPIRVIA